MGLQLHLKVILSEVKNLDFTEVFEIKLFGFASE
jgi:hypothetical protein